MTPGEIASARQALNVSIGELAKMLDSDAQSVRRWLMNETASTRRDMPPRAERLLRAYLAGYRPDDWPEKHHPAMQKARHPCG